MTTSSTGTGRIRPLALLVQLIGLRQQVPGSTGSVRHDQLRWEGAFRPTVRSAEYRVAICMRLGQRPTITVLEPPLEHWNDEPLPHTFADGSLCLFRRSEWDPSKPLSITVVPWISEWLYFYEFWLGTGVWLGGGHEAGKKD